MAKKIKPATHPLKITDTTLRDGTQSLFATRMRTEDMLEIAAKIDEVGFHSLEVWGGATFDVMHRFLTENPFDRLRALRKAAPKTPFQMLLRGQNLVGYRNYPDDVVRAFVEHAADVGMDIFRVFDALNDPRNLEAPGRAVLDCGKHFQAAISYSITERKIGGPVFNEKYYIRKVREYLALGAQSLCVKDMAGMISPDDAHLLVSLIKSETDIPVQLHTHYTSGMGSMAYLRAADAGVDVIDCAVAPFALRSSQPAMEPIIVTFEGTPRDTGLDLKLISDIGKRIEKVAPKYDQFRDQSKWAQIDVDVLIHQIPGGMQSNMVNQLKQADALDRMPEVHAELPRTRRELGTPPLVTPTSQIVGTQAVMNVLMGRYKMISGEVKDLCYGLYGETPTEIDPEVRKICLKDYPRGETPITGRAASYLDPELPAAGEKVAALYKEAGRTGTPDRDHVMIYALYPRTGETFIRWALGLSDKRPGEQPKTFEDLKHEAEIVRKARAGELVTPTPKLELGPNARTFKVAIDGETFEVLVEAEGGAPVIKNARPLALAAGHATTATSIAPPPKAAPAKGESAKGATLPPGQTAILAPMPGTLLSYLVKVGDAVKEGQPVLKLEAMKMENQLSAPRTGAVVALGPAVPAAVARGDVLMVIE